MKFRNVLWVGLAALAPMWFANHATAAVSEYRIATEKVTWNYIPSGLMIPEHGGLDFWPVLL
ncbi:MAG: hypothetical protein HY272_07685 [Gammaproteobacteria bacterium]|nr:hypothetical protein [Gammaproteobacteria bacterium]